MIPTGSLLAVDELRRMHKIERIERLQQVHINNETLLSLVTPLGASYCLMG